MDGNCEVAYNDSELVVGLSTNLPLFGGWPCDVLNPERLPSMIVAEIKQNYRSSTFMDGNRAEIVQE